MNRKLFLSSLLPASAMLYAFNGNAATTVLTETAAKHKRPPYLKQGDIIGITCPAAFITH